MNIADSEAPYEMTAKTCESNGNGRKVIYSFVESCNKRTKENNYIIIY